MKMNPFLPIGLTAKRSIGVTLDGSGVELTTGQKGFEALPFSGMIWGWRIEAKEVGDVVIDVWKAPGTPNLTNSICGTKPFLSTQQINQGDTSDWIETECVRGEVIGFNVQSVSGITRLTIALDVVMV